MTEDTGFNQRGYEPLRIAARVPGERTGEEIIVTADGRNWREWNGRIATGEEVRRKDQGDRLR